MFPFAHFFTGYVVAVVLIPAGLVELTGVNVVLFGVLSLLPDADAFWHSEIGSHHLSLFHAPIFWILVSTVTSALFPQKGIILASATLTHILTDFVTGRTVGVAFLYPFSSDEYSLYSLNDETSQLNPVRPRKDVLKRHLSMYLENKTLIMFEAAVNLAGAAGLLVLVLWL